MRASSRTDRGWIALLVVTILVAIIAIALLSPTDILDRLTNPTVAAIIGGAFVFLVLDRLKEMNGRLDSSESRWQELNADFNGRWEALRTELDNRARDIAAEKAERTARDYIETIENRVKAFHERVDELERDNPWLTELRPQDIAIGTKHLEPLFHVAKELVGKGHKGEAITLVTKALEDPDMQGTPHDYHNLGVFAAVDLRDDLLAGKIHEAYLNKLGPNESPDADVVADQLQIYTRSRNLVEAANVAKVVSERLDAGDPEFARKWRPWVFLADYHAVRGEEEKALELLQQASEQVKGPARVRVLTNIADRYKENGDWENAERILLDGLNSYPSDVPAANLLARIQWERGNTDGAIRILVATLARGNLNSTFEPHVAQAKSDLERLLSARMLANSSLVNEAEDREVASAQVASAQVASSET